jgi:hypothetical protein
MRRALALAVEVGGGRPCQIEAREHIREHLQERDIAERVAEGKGHRTRVRTGHGNAAELEEQQQNGGKLPISGPQTDPASAGGVRGVREVAEEYENGDSLEKIHSSVRV